MAHLVDSLAWSGQVPWHGLGTKLPENVTGEDMVRVAGLDWQVIPKPLFAGLDEATGYGVSVPGFKALVREDRPHVTLSVVSESYGIIQNTDALTLLDAAVGEGSAAYHVAGALDVREQEDLPPFEAATSEPALGPVRVMCSPADPHPLAFQEEKQHRGENCPTLAAPGSARCTTAARRSRGTRAGSSAGARSAPDQMR